MIISSAKKMDYERGKTIAFSISRDLPYPDLSESVGSLDEIARDHLRDYELPLIMLTRVSGGVRKNALLAVNDLDAFLQGFVDHLDGPDPRQYFARKPLCRIADAIYSLSSDVLTIPDIFYLPQINIQENYYIHSVNGGYLVEDIVA